MVKSSILCYAFIVVLLNAWIIQVHCITLEEQFHKISRPSRQKRYLTFPYGTAIGLLLAFAIPVDLPNQDILFSYYYEANYNLPDQLYYFGTPPPPPDLNTDPDIEVRSLRKFNRKIAFQTLERRIESFGFNGRECLLRLICDMGKTPVHQQGLMGQLLHILFTPSTTSAEGLPKKFRDAEELGAQNGNCDSIYSGCPQSLIDMFTSVE